MTKKRKRKQPAALPSEIEGGDVMMTKKKGPLAKGPKSGSTKKGKGATREQPKGKGGVTR